MEWVEIIKNILGFFPQFINGGIEAVRDRRNAKRSRYLNLYCPMHALLLNFHLAISTSQKYPHFSQRFNRSLLAFKIFEFEDAYKFLLDKGNKISAEIEYGTAFPIDEIKGILQSNIQYADQKLILLVHNAVRSSLEDLRYNMEQNDLISNEEYELISYIRNEFNKLNNKFSY